ncbi:unnamed protein product [Cyprideis torosa]|uniref:Uncharacterized protein n=1 Tax=Cyprideis torosa TaxID=163714 RepID=A0A7R8ZQX5_9CRUS|nr:unnamed protein product [Cyprideis torosa]CAG0893003.1 unnamed protein product [Cyprideis torosa]
MPKQYDLFIVNVASTSHHYVTDFAPARAPCPIESVPWMTGRRIATNQQQMSIDEARQVIFDSVHNDYANKIGDREAAAEIFSALIGNAADEHIAAIFLDTRGRVITAEILFHGTINTTTVHIRAIVRRALMVNASSIVLAHNHPSGITEPSLPDIDITNDIIVLNGRRSASITTSSPPAPAGEHCG